MDDNTSEPSPWRLVFMNAAMWGFDALYTLSPVDAIPDVIPLVGWMDDVLLFVWCVVFTVRTVRRLCGVPRGWRASLASRLIRGTGVDGSQIVDKLPG